jgi:DNA polymerase delta subunit 2
LAKFYSPDDNIMLEDESGRIQLVGERVVGARLVTGVIIAALGIETPTGEFEVVDICYAEMAPQPGHEESEGKMEVDGTLPVSLPGLGLPLFFYASRPSERRVDCFGFRP